MTENNSDQLIQEALKECDKWIAAFKTDGKSNVKAISKVLNARTFEGKPVKANVFKSPSAAIKYLKKLYKTASPEDKKVIKESHNCIWDYYLMAFYESACSVLPDRNFEGAEFIYQSMYPAFQAGLGFVICLGDVLIGICLPEAHTDENFLLHNETGPAIKWGSEKYYYWHGVEIDENWIMAKDKLDPLQAIQEQNIEKRRVLAEIIGWDKILNHLDCTTLHTDEYGVLLEVNLPDSEKSRFVRVRCPTGRNFCIPVPETVKTAREAVTISYGINKEQNYAPEVRT